MSYHEDWQVVDCPRCGAQNHALIVYPGDNRANEWETGECHGCGRVLVKEKCGMILIGPSREAVTAALRRK